MNISDAIKGRRSIRRFLDKEIDKDIILKILDAGILAPSPKNNQPWRFYIVTKETKEEMINIIKNGIKEIRASFGSLVSGDFLNSAEATLKTMEEAPVTIFVINVKNKMKFKHSPVSKFLEMANIQAIGAAIENMALASLEYGIGSLWIGDIFFNYSDISKWLCTDKQVVAAVSFGYPAETPHARPRKELDSIIEWR